MNEKELKERNEFLRDLLEGLEDARKGRVVEHK